MFCKHVYEETRTDICDDCGQPTRRIKWEEQHALHRDWIESGKATPQGWWSI